MNRKILRALRFLLGLANLAALVCVFAIPPDPIEPMTRPVEWLAWLAKLQFAPAVLALDAAVLAALVAVTLFCGRFYCEVVCPLGVSQDVLRKSFFFVKRLAVRRVCSRLPVSRPQLAVRLAVLAAAVAATAAGLVGYAWVDPYGIFGRAAVWIRGVAVSSAPLAQGAGGWLEALLAAGPFALVMALVFVGKGRFWCNWICPVGTVFAGLAWISRRSGKMDRTAFDAHCGNCCACFQSAAAKGAQTKRGDEGGAE